MSKPSSENVTAAQCHTGITVTVDAHATGDVGLTKNWPVRGAKRPTQACARMAWQANKEEDVTSTTSNALSRALGPSSHPPLMLQNPCRLSHSSPSRFQPPP